MSTEKLAIVTLAIFLLGSFSTCSYDNHLDRQNNLEVIQTLTDANVSEQGIDCILNTYGGSEARRNACASWVEDSK